MILNIERKLRSQIIETGRKLQDMRLVAGTSGNLSARLDKNNILITATQAALGEIGDKEIIKVDLTEEGSWKQKPLTTEFPLHQLIYKNFDTQVVIHCHPALINGYFAVYSDIRQLTFETKLFLGSVPVVEQETPAVTKPELVIEALRLSNLVVLKNHGVVCIGKGFREALGLVDTLEEAVKTAALARLFKKEILDDLDEELKQVLSSRDIYPMFSLEHIQAIVELVNKDEFIAKKGEEQNLTLKLAIKMDSSDKVYKFNFEKGRIVELEFDADAPFVISAPKDIWELVFLGKLDPFVATTQGRMRLKGELGRLAAWYVSFSRLFQIFKEVKIK